jgi:hypothetical protein
LSFISFSGLFGLLSYLIYRLLLTFILTSTFASFWQCSLYRYDMESLIESTVFIL